MYVPKTIDGLSRAGRSGSGGIAEIWQKCLFSLLLRGLCMTLFMPTHVAVLAGNLNPISLQRLIRQPYISIYVRAL